MVYLFISLSIICLPQRYAVPSTAHAYLLLSVLLKVCPV